MATLSKHGGELARIERLDHKLAYMADGSILINRGDGWKVWGRVKPGIVPAEAAQRAVDAYAAKLRNGPAFARWRELVHELTSPARRWMVIEAIKLMPDDADGVWSALDDDGQHDLSLDDCVNLCNAYRDAIAESKAARSASTLPELV